MACFADINVPQGSVATYARCSRIFDIHLTENLPWNLPVKKLLKLVGISQNYGHESVTPFFAHPVCAAIMDRHDVSWKNESTLLINRHKRSTKILY